MTLRKQIAAFMSLVFAAGTAGAQDLKSGPYKLPYKNTYVKEVFVAENEFRTAKPEHIKPRTFAEARKILPSPVWEGHEKEVEMYWHAWQIAVGNIRQPQEDSGFVSPYLDIAYNGNIFMWDASFMMMFARYGYRFFPFQRTLDNFYAKQLPDGCICREIRADGSDCFERYDPTSTGPNLLPWVELMYYRQFGDIDRLHRVVPALCAYAKWWRLNRTGPDGTYWSSGWGTGMDNMPRVKPEYNPIFSHGHMVWLDTNLQQMLVDESLLNIGFYIERWQEIEDMEDEMKRLRAYVNEHLWDERTAFLYDRYGDGTLCTTQGIGAFWALPAAALDKARACPSSCRHPGPGRRFVCAPWQHGCAANLCRSAELSFRDGHRRWRGRKPDGVSGHYPGGRAAARAGRAGPRSAAGTTGARRVLFLGAARAFRPGAVYGDSHRRTGV